MDIVESNSLNDLKERIKNLEDIELRDQDETSDNVYKHLLIYYLLDENVMKAKILWKRIPKQLKSEQQTELNKLWNLVQHQIQRHYTQTFELINRHRNANALNMFSNQELNNLVLQFADKTRERLLNLIDAAYSSISIQELSQMLGLNSDEVVRICLLREWELDETKNFLFPKRKENKENVGISNRVQMQQLTSLVSYLEAC